MESVGACWASASPPIFWAIRSANLTSNNCNTAVGADLNGKRSVTRASIQSAIDTDCSLSGVTVRDLYPRCPSPVASSDDGGATTGIDSYTELATCLMDLTEAYVNRAGAEVMGAPIGPFPISDGKQDCQGAIGKALSKAIKTAGKVYTKCQKGQEKLGAGLDYDASCLDAAGDPKAKAAGAIAAVKAAIDASCTTAEIPDQAAWASLGTCGQSGTQMKSCAVDRVVEPLSKGLVAAALELPGTCAAEADITVNAAYGAKLTNSRFDLGWKGTGHEMDVPGAWKAAVTLSGCDPDCRDCTVTHNARNGNCRCESDATAVCDTIEGADFDDCGGGMCHCMLGPPQAASASSVPLCIVHRLASDFPAGSTPEMGEYEVLAPLRTIVHTGISHVQPCPICVGDATPNDGIRTGTCEDGDRDGMDCDENAEHPDYGPVSYDCPPDPLANISGAGVRLAPWFSSGNLSLTAARPASAGVCTNGPCHCGACTGDPHAGCANDLECAAFGLGTCGAAVPVASQQNQCTGGTANCLSDGVGNGTCNAGPFEDKCDGFLENSGRGILDCTDDADCDSNDCDGDNVLTLGECGTCTYQDQRQCFLPTISVTGTPGVFSSESVSISCSGTSAGAGVDSVFGLPGPSRMRLDLDIKPYCADGTTAYQVPGGSNCNP